MNLVAIVGSTRKGKSTDTLVDKAIEGFRARAGDSNVRKIYLMDYDIQFCRNCLACRDSKTEGPIAACAIRDDMEQLKEAVLDSDVLIFGTPVHMGYATAVMMTFLERICWTFGKPGRKVFTVKGCPLPRTSRKRKAAIIVTSGIVPPVYRRFCDWASKQINGVVVDSLNGKIVGNLYAGDIEHRGVESYLDKAYALGLKLL